MSLAEETTDVLTEGELLGFVETYLKLGFLIRNAQKDKDKLDAELKNTNILSVAENVADAISPLLNN